MASIKLKVNLDFFKNIQEEKSQVCLPLNLSAEQIKKIKSILNKDNNATITIEPFYEARSLNANAYAWKLCDLIAQAVKSDKDTIHEQMLLKYGVFATYSIKSDIVDSACRNFDYYRILGESELKGVKFTHIQAVVGSHKYNSKEMHRFIEGIVQEAQDLEIETIPQKEIDLMCKSCGV